MDIKVTLVSDEFFAWGRYGGFGFFTRKLGSELVKRGFIVDCWVQNFNIPNQPKIGEVEVINGVNVKVTPRLRHKLGKKLLLDKTTDIVHSECNEMDTYFVFSQNPQAKKVLTYQDIWDREDWKNNIRLASVKPRGFGGEISYKIFQELYGWSARHSDYVATQARLLTQKAIRLYRLKQEPFWLPNFIDVPASIDAKCKTPSPSVLWLARLDPIKHPELMFELARKNPTVSFFVPGKANFLNYGKQLLKKYSTLPNVHILGKVSEEEKINLLKQSWILINTSFCEAMPVSFLEGIAYGCALLSTRNPDGYTEKFGVYTPTQEVSELQAGLEYLIKDDAWRSLGVAAHEYALRYHETNKCVENHINLYRKLLES